MTINAKKGDEFLNSFLSVRTPVEQTLSWSSAKGSGFHARMTEPPRAHLRPTRYALDCTIHRVCNHSVEVGRPFISCRSNHRVFKDASALSEVRPHARPFVIAAATKLRSDAALAKHFLTSRKTRVPSSRPSSSAGHNAGRFKLCF